MPSGAVASRHTPNPETDDALVTSAQAVRLPGRAIHLADDDSGDGPASTWIQVLRVGKFWSPRYKDFSVTKATLRRMVANFTTLTPKPPTELPLDYNHGTNRPDTIEQGKAAGWIKGLELREKETELWAQVELTAEAADLVRNKEYRFVSATFEFDHVHTDGEQRKKHVGATLMAAALTNTPFVEGMQPVTLDKDSSVALADDAEEVAEAAFSFGEQMRRVQEALSERAGTPEYSGCYGGPYLNDLYDGYAVYSQGGGCKYRIDFTIGANGAVTFTSDPVEVRVAYEPLSSAPGATEMAIKVKDAKGNEVELTDEVVKALAKAHAPTAPVVDDDTAALDEVRTELTKAQADNVSLSERIAKLELDKKEMAAKGLVDALIRAGKVPTKKRDQYVKLAIADRKTFDELTTDLPKIYEYDHETGSGESGAGLTATQEAIALARTEMDSDKTLKTQADALNRVFARNPELYARYSREAAIKV